MTAPAAQPTLAEVGCATAASGSGDHVDRLSGYQLLNSSVISDRRMQRLGRLAPILKCVWRHGTPTHRFNGGRTASGRRFTSFLWTQTFNCLVPKRPLRPISREICRSGHILCACASRTKNDVVSVGTGVMQSARVQGLCHQGTA